jgi:hypothetical protein
MPRRVVAHRVKVRNLRKISDQYQMSSTSLDIALGRVYWSMALAVLAAGIAQAQSRADYCGAIPPAGFEAPPNQAHTGRYVNHTYGYSVAIPAGLTAFTSARGPERGFIIGLSDRPHGFLRVDASYDAFYDITAAGVHRRDLNALRLHDAVLSDAVADAMLDQVPGGRFVMRLQCRGEAAAQLHEEIIVLRNREIYRLDLQSTPERYAADRLRLDAMLKSWRWEAIQ